MDLKRGVGKGDRKSSGASEEGEEKALNPIQLSWKGYILKSKEI